MSTPTPPDYTEFLQRLVARITSAGGAAVQSPYDGAPAAVADALEAAVVDAGDDLVALSHDIHAHPELGYAEHHAAAAVAAFLRDRGHEVTAPAYGLDTAVHARAGEGRPRVAFLAEYDALPGIGHACGHNVICTTAVGGFLAAAAVVSQVGGSVELIGTPAEEGGGGKEVIARAGGFDEVDAAVMLHPFFADIASHPFIGVRTVEAVFTGMSTHASAMPFLGRNALDAAVQAYTGIAQLRQHMLPTDRVHGIFTDGGQKPNIVPERAAVEFYVRSAEPSTLAELCRRVDAIFEGAAAQAGCGVEVTWDVTPVYLPTRLNGPLTNRYAVNAARRGRQLLPPDVVPAAMTGSTDLGNVSVRVPAIHPMIGVAPFGVSLHTPEFEGHAASPAADAAVVDGAVALGLTALDYLADEGLRRAVADDFDAAGGRMDVEAVYP
ncbi:amidohydrolase [Euzebya sp.]|uniref:amidohydrolase n=1 Tax=Euzebya sp. TaxID=1971409 RepID=UPI00351838E3